MALASKFPSAPDQRFAVNLAALAEHVGMLLRTTLVLEPGANVVNYVATISSGYTTGQPTVVMPNGAVAGPYPVWTGYTPHAGDTVLMVPNGQSYVILGTFA